MQNFPIRKILPGFSWFLRILQLQDCLLRNRDVMVHLRRPSDNMLQDIAPVCSVSCQNFFTYSKTDCFLIFSQGREKSMLPILFGNPNHVKSLIKHSRTIFRYVSEISPCRKMVISFNHIMDRKKVCRTGAFCVSRRLESLRALLQRTAQLVDAKFWHVLCAAATKI